MASAARALGRAQAALARGEPAEAVRLARLAVERRADWRQALLWLAAALSEDGDLDAALSALAKAAASRAPDGLHRLFEGRVLLDHGRYEDAARVFADGLRLAPDNLHLPGYAALSTWAHDGAEPPGIRDLAEAAAWGAGLWGRWLLCIEERFPGGPGTDYPEPTARPSGPLERLARWRSRRLAARAASAASGRGAARAARLLDRAEALWPLDDESAELRTALGARAAAALAARLPDEGDDPDIRLDLAEDLIDCGDPRAALSVLEPLPRLVEAIDRGRLGWVAGTALLVGRALLAADRAAESLEPLELATSLLAADVEPRYFLAVGRLRAGDRRGARRAFVEVCHMDGALGLSRLRELGAASATP